MDKESIRNIGGMGWTEGKDMASGGGSVFEQAGCIGVSKEGDVIMQIVREAARELRNKGQWVRINNHRQRERAHRRKL